MGRPAQKCERCGAPCRGLMSSSSYCSRRCRDAQDFADRESARMEMAPVHAAWLEVALADAERHGLESEPDHEVGDPHALVRLMWANMAPEDRARVVAEWRAWDHEEPEVPTCRGCGAAEPADPCAGCGLAWVDPAR